MDDPLGRITYEKAQVQYRLRNGDAMINLVVTFYEDKPRDINITNKSGNKFNFTHSDPMLAEVILELMQSAIKVANQTEHEWGKSL